MKVTAALELYAWRLDTHAAHLYGEHAPSRWPAIANVQDTTTYTAKSACPRSASHKVAHRNCPRPWSPSHERIARAGSHYPQAQAPRGVCLFRANLT